MQGTLLTVLNHHERFQLPHVIPDQVRPRRPTRQSKPHASQTWLERDLHSNKMLVGITQIEVNLNHSRIQDWCPMISSALAEGSSSRSERSAK